MKQQLSARAWHDRHDRRPDLNDNLAANDDAELDGWSWPSFGWGTVAGFYVGAMFTVTAAYLWGLYL